MATDVLFIHSAGSQTGEQGSTPFARHLRRGLGAAFKLRCPTMPLPDNPSYERWKGELEKQIAEARPPRILVGHSLGGSVLLKYLSERGRAAWPAGLFLVAMPYWGEQDWQVDEFVLRHDFARFLPDTLQVHLYQSRDDDVVSIDHLTRYANAIPWALVHALDGGGHTFAEGLPELVRDIQALPR